MKYKNTKTGAIIDSSCKIAGGDWIRYVVEKREEAETLENNPVVKTTVEKEITEGHRGSSDDVTKNQIMQELDAMGIKYDPKSRKDELYNLMIKGA